MCGNDGNRRGTTGTGGRFLRGAGPAVLALLFVAATATGVLAQDRLPPLSPDSVRVVGEEAAVFGLPLVRNYTLLHSVAADTTSPLFSPPNRFKPAGLVPELSTNLLGTFDSGTSFCLAYLDLREGPMVISVPRVSDRYYSIQLVDMLTDNFAYIGTRPTGDRTGTFLVVGPGWKGELPFPGELTQVLPSPSWIVLVIGRTELDEADSTRAAQAWKDFRIQSLTEYRGRPAPPLPPVDWPPPADAETSSAADFYRVLNFAMQWQVFLPEEKPLLNAFTRIGVAPGEPFGAGDGSAPRLQALGDALAAARKEIQAAAESLIVVRGDWGTLPDGVGNAGTDYLARATVSWRLPYVNSREETLYFLGRADSLGASLDGASGRYIVTFDRPPPTRYFWSMSAVDARTLQVEAGSVREFLDDEKRKTFDLTLAVGKKKKTKPFRILIQREEPPLGQDETWLRTPDGPFLLLLQVFGPIPTRMGFDYEPPPIVRESGAGSE